MKSSFTNIFRRIKSLIPTRKKTCNFKLATAELSQLVSKSTLVRRVNAGSKFGNVQLNRRRPALAIFFGPQGSRLLVSQNVTVLGIGIECLAGPQSDVAQVA